MLKFYSNAKVLCYIRELENRQPVHLEIHPSMSCNHKCLWCRYPHSKNQLTYHHMISKLNKYPRVKGVLLSGGGEPLVNKNTVQFIRECGRRGVQVGLNTNGGLLTDDNIKVIARNCWYCRISLDAATPKTYKLVHGSLDFHRILDNIRKLRDHDIRELGISYLVTEDNVGEIEELATLHLPVDYIHFKPLIEGIKPLVKDEAVMRLKRLEEKINIRWDRILQDDTCNNKIPCRITSLIRLIGGDGLEYTCCEKAYQPKFESGKWFGDTSECLSCRYNGYNEVLESYYDGGMAKEFL